MAGEANAALEKAKKDLEVTSVVLEGKKKAVRDLEIATPATHKGVDFNREVDEANEEIKDMEGKKIQWLQPPLRATAHCAACP